MNENRFVRIDDTAHSSHKTASDHLLNMMSPSGVPWITVVHRTKHNQAAHSGESNPSGTRMSVTLPADHYKQIQQLAAKKKVSIAWVVRDAVDQYVAAHSDPKARRVSAQKPHASTSRKGGA